MTHRGHNLDRLGPSLAHGRDHGRERAREVTRAQKNHAPRWSHRSQRRLVITDGGRADGHFAIKLIVLPPMISIHPQRLEIVVGQNTEHRTRVNRAFAKRVQRKENGDAGR